MKKSITLAPELARKLVRRQAALTIKRGVANTMAAAGLTFENEGDRAFVDSVATLNGNYRLLIYEVTQAAIEAGYDPVNHEALTVYPERGVAIWEDGEPDKIGGEEDEREIVQGDGKGTE